MRKIAHPFWWSNATLDGPLINQSNLLVLSSYTIIISLRASLEDRIEYAGNVITLLGIWRNFMVLSNEMTLCENFLSRETFQDSPEYFENEFFYFPSLIKQFSAMCIYLSCFLEPV